jgi:hypothetical protein
MRSSPVSLYLRVRSPEGGWLYARSVTASNGRIRPLHALIDGKPVYRDEGVYHLRYSLDGKRRSSRGRLITSFMSPATNPKPGTLRDEYRSRMSLMAAGRERTGSSSTLPTTK